MTSEQPPLEEFGEPETDLSNEEWEEVVFSDVISINDYPSAEKGEEYRSVGMSDVARDQRKIEDWEYKEYSYSRPRFRNSQTLMARITPCLENGKTAFVDILEDNEVAVGSTEFIVLSDTDRTLPKFVYYTARRPEIRQFAIKRMTGTSGRQRVPLDIFDNKKINLPPIEEQKKIVSILDAIDSKIEINNRVNEILEEMAQALFKSWFVNFDPYDEFKQSKLGEIPEDFEILQISDVCSTRGGGTPSTDNDEYWGGDNLWLTPKEVTSLKSKIVFDTEKKVSDEGMNNSSTAIMPEESVLLTSRATVGEVVVNREPMGTNQGFICIEPNDRVEPYYLSCLVEDKRPEIENRASGSTYDEISQTSFNEIQIFGPPEEDIRDFESKVKSMYEDIYTRELENRRLDELRDTLIPKLMSGEIRVNDIELDELEVDSEV